MVLAPNGNIITTNGGDGNMVETTPGRQAGGGPDRRQEDRSGIAVRSRTAPTARPSTTWTTAKTRQGADDPTQPAPATGSGTGAAENVSLEANPEGQLKYNKTSLTTNAGKVSIAFTNMAPVEHNVTVESSSGESVGATPTFKGGSKTLALNLKPGTYKFFCSVPGHRMAGMEGTLTVH